MGSKRCPAGHLPHIGLGLTPMPELWLLVSCNIVSAVANTAMTGSVLKKDVSRQVQRAQRGRRRQRPAARIRHPSALCTAAPSTSGADAVLLCQVHARINMLRDGHTIFMCMMVIASRAAQRQPSSGAGSSGAFITCICRWTRIWSCMLPCCVNCREVSCRHCVPGAAAGVQPRPVESAC